MNYGNLCINCMHEKKGGESVCPHCGFDDRTYSYPASALPPYTILNGKYILGKMLGAGGFGITYIGFDTALEKVVAIKEFFVQQSMYRDTTKSFQMTVSSSTDEQQSIYEINREKFAKEARTLARLEKIPGIVRVYDLFEENDTLYIVMEYLPGMTLKDYCRKNGKMSFQETLQLMTPMMDSLAALHDVGIYHRDISPDNIMVGRDKTLTLYDFGGAKVRGNGEKSRVIMAKAGYSPVEQMLSDGNIGPWIDIYSLSATMYFCITGEVPVEAPARVGGKDPLKKPRSLKAEITPLQEKALLKGMAVRYSERYSSMKEMKAALGGTRSTRPLIIGGAAAAVAVAGLIIALLTRGPEDIGTTASASSESRKGGQTVSSFVEPAVSESSEASEAAEEPAASEAAEEPAESEASEAAAVSEAAEEAAVSEAAEEQAVSEASEAVEEQAVSEAAEEQAVSETAEEQAVSEASEAVEEPAVSEAANETEVSEVTGETGDSSTSEKTGGAAELPGTVYTEPLTSLDVNIGDTITLGAWEQDGNEENGPEELEWIVLKKTVGELLITTKSCVSVRPFSDGGGTATWENSSVRQWLNGEFLQAFDEGQMNAIVTHQISNPANASSGTGAGSDTEDRVFLLSEDEARAYFVSDEKRKAGLSASAGEDGEIQNIDWLLRTSGQTGSMAALVSSGGVLNETGTDTGNTAGIRPAVWVNISLLPEGTRVVRGEYAAGDPYVFGAYEQDNNEGNGMEALEWYVLSREEDHLLLLSRYCIDALPYSLEEAETNWENSYMRKWLNEDWFTAVFSDDEKNCIASEAIPATENSQTKMYCGGTTDRLFLLSEEEVSAYMPSAETRGTPATAFAVGHGCVLGENGNCYWYLRTPGSDMTMLEEIGIDGAVSYSGNLATNGQHGIRPAMWVTLP